MTIALVIVALALWLLLRWRRGVFSHDHPHPVRARTPWQAFAIGVVHGIGGTGGVGVLLLATIDDRALALGALALFAVFTALSMALVSGGFGAALGRPRVQRTFHVVAPGLGVASLGFGVWYALGALALAPYWL